MNVIAATYRVQVHGSVGTMFALEVGSQQYLITARHVVKGLNGVCEIEWEDGWQAMPVELVGHGDGPIDISVLSTQHHLPESLYPKWKSPEIDSDLKLGQDVRFYGFPFGWSTTRGGRTVPIPLVKAGIVSGFFGQTSFGPRSSFLVDGHNNPGFSGGPLVSIRDGQYRVAGVVSGYLPYDEDVVASASDEATTQLGFVKQNSGIMLAWNIQHAVDIIADASTDGTKLTREDSVYSSDRK